MVGETLDLRELLSALYRRKGIIVLMVVVSVLTAYVASSPGAPAKRFSFKA